MRMLCAGAMAGLAVGGLAVGGALVGLGAAALTGGAVLGAFEYVHDKAVGSQTAGNTCTYMTPLWEHIF